MQAVFSGIGFGLFFLLYAFGLNLGGYNRYAVTLCAAGGLMVLLWVYRWRRNEAVNERKSD
jgi:hypothetical protein